MDELIAAAGFHTSEASAEYVKGPRILGYVFSARARLAGDAPGTQR